MSSTGAAGAGGCRPTASPAAGPPRVRPAPGAARTPPQRRNCGRSTGPASAADVSWVVKAVRTVIAPPGPRRSAPGGGLAVLVVVTVLAALAAPHAQTLRGLVAAALPTAAAPEPPGARPAADSRAARAVAFALRQRGKPYRWGAKGPHAYDCSGLTWAAWRAAGVTIPRTAAGQLAGVPRVRGRLQPGDLLIYPSRGPSRRHVAMVVGRGRMVDAPGRGIPIRSTSIRRGWLGVVRPGGGR
jgi:cell wall-associated NlpC family hydrolase